MVGRDSGNREEGAGGSRNIHVVLLPLERGRWHATGRRGEGDGITFRHTLALRIQSDGRRDAGIDGQERGIGRDRTSGIGYHTTKLVTVHSYRDDHV